MQRGVDRPDARREPDLEGRIDACAGRSRSSGRPGASWRGSTPMTWRYCAMLVRRFGFGEAGLRAGGGEARLGLGDVGAGHFADVEAVARLPQLLVEHLDVVALQVEDGRVAQHVHVGRARH